MSKPQYDSSRGQYVLQIRSVTGEWEDYLTIKNQGELEAAVIRALCCQGAGDRAGTMRVVHKFMGDTVVIADYR